MKVKAELRKKYLTLHGNDMKAKYIAPGICMVHIGMTSITAASSFSVTVSSDTYEGEGRVKQELVSNPSVWDDDWSSK
jgi:hypothetical protein